MNQNISSHLTRLTDVYVRAVGRKHDAVLGVAGGYHGLYTRIKEGSSCTIRVYERATEWFSNNWPEDTKWPAGIPRPAPSKKKRKA